MSSTALKKHEKLVEHQKRRQEKKVTAPKAESPSSSDVADAETDQKTLATFDQGCKFVDLVLNTLELPAIEDIEKSSHLGGSGDVNTQDLERALKTILPNKQYQISHLHKISMGMHAIFGKLPLKPKEAFNILLTSKIMPDSELVGKDEAVFAVSRSFKYIILRNN